MPLRDSIRHMMLVLSLSAV